MYNTTMIESEDSLQPRKDEAKGRILANGADGLAGILTGASDIVSAIGDGVSKSLAAANNKTTTVNIDEKRWFSFDQNTSKWIAIGGVGVVALVVVLVVVLRRKD